MALLYPSINGCFRSHWYFFGRVVTFVSLPTGVLWPAHLCAIQGWCQLKSRKDGRYELLTLGTSGQVVAWNLLPVGWHRYCHEMQHLGTHRGNHLSLELLGKEIHREAVFFGTTFADLQTLHAKLDHFVVGAVRYGKWFIHVPSIFNFKKYPYLLWRTVRRLGAALRSVRLVLLPGISVLKVRHFTGHDGCEMYEFNPSHCYGQQLKNWMVQKTKIHIRHEESIRRLVRLVVQLSWGQSKLAINDNVLEIDLRNVVSDKRTAHAKSSSNQWPVDKQSIVSICYFHSFLGWYKKMTNIFK